MQDLELKATQRQARIADALTAIVKHGESLSASMLRAARKQEVRDFECVYDAAWAILYSAGCDTDDGTRWARLLDKILDADDTAVVA